MLLTHVMFRNETLLALRFNASHTEPFCFCLRAMSEMSSDWLTLWSPLYVDLH